MKFDLQTRDLKTGSTSPKTFESVEEGLTWLKARPKYVDVMGIASHHVPLDISDQLKAAMGPLLAHRAPACTASQVNLRRGPFWHAIDRLAVYGPVRFTERILGRLTGRLGPG